MRSKNIELHSEAHFQEAFVTLVITYVIFLGEQKQQQKLPWRIDLLQFRLHLAFFSCSNNCSSASRAGRYLKKSECIQIHVYVHGGKFQTSSAPLFQLQVWSNFPKVTVTLDWSLSKCWRSVNRPMATTSECDVPLFPISNRCILIGNTRKENGRSTSGR